MITEIDFKVKGEERKKLAYAIAELLEIPVKYTRTPKFDYLIGSCILDKNGVFHASEDLTESKLELVLERFYKGEPIQQSEHLEVVITENQVSFPWFPLASEPDAVNANTEFIPKLCELAIKLKRVSLTDKEVENEKYAFRCFLLRLGFIGDDSKTARRILLQNLSGNSAFRKA